MRWREKQEKEGEKNKRKSNVMCGSPFPSNSSLSWTEYINLKQNELLAFKLKIQTQKGSNERLFILTQTHSKHTVSILCARVKMNKRSLEPFRVWILEILAYFAGVAPLNKLPLITCVPPTTNCPGKIDVTQLNTATPP